MHSQLDHAMANTTGIAAAISFGCRVETTPVVLVFCLFRQPDSSSSKRLGLGPDGSCSFVSALVGQWEMWLLERWERGVLYWMSSIILWDDEWHLFLLSSGRSLHFQPCCRWTGWKVQRCPFFLEAPLLQVTPVDREPILNKILTLRIKMYGNQGLSLRIMLVAAWSLSSSRYTLEPDPGAQVFLTPCSTYREPWLPPISHLDFLWADKFVCKALLPANSCHEEIASDGTNSVDQQRIDKKKKYLLKHLFSEISHFCQWSL